MPLRLSTPPAASLQWTEPIPPTRRGARDPLPLITPEVPERAEARERVVHVVEYSRYPRRVAEEGRRIAYTQDRSVTGLGLDLPEAVDPGELLRVTLRDIDGGIDMDGLARVVWCSPQGSGRARAGVAMLREKGERPMMRVRARSRSARNADAVRRAD